MISSNPETLRPSRTLSRPDTDNSLGSTPSSQTDSADLLGALWRYRWAVLLPAIAGGIIGFLVFLRTPETYRSSTQIIIRSDRPAVLDSTGDWMGGVPSIDVVRAQLLSDSVASMAFDSPVFQPYRARYGNDKNRFIAVSREKLKLESMLDDLYNTTSLVALMHYDGDDKGLCHAAVEAFSDSLQKYFNQLQQEARGELIRLTKKAKDQILPEMEDLEQDYQDFRRDAPLQWDSEGKAINPHRERQLFLVAKRSELIEQQRHRSIELASVESIAKKSSNDPLLGLNIIGQLLGTTFVLPNQIEVQEDSSRGDVTLGMIALDESLVPMMIERNKFVAEFGANHPTVKALDSQLATMKNELRRLVEDKASRIVELMEKDKREVVDPQQRASEAVSAVIFAARAQVALISQQIQDVDNQISDEKLAASKMAEHEQEYQSHLRKIAQTRGLLKELEDKVARVELIAKEGGTKVTELTKPTQAFQIGPNIVRSLGFGVSLGLVLGAGLALLLEKNANTFRDPDEISELLGLPVLTHVPFFKGRVKKPQKGEINPYKDLDPFLAVVHQPASVAAEAIRSCRTSIFFDMMGEGGKLLQVTSPLPGDGKSTIAGNLACSIAQSGKRVLAIDCDLRRPQLTDNFALTNDKGLSNVLNGDCEPCEAIHQTPLATLQVMPSGPIPANPAEALTLPEMADLLELMKDQFDYVVIDTPPLLVVTDPSITASMVDGVVLALRIRRKSKPNSRESVNILRAVGANVLGIVINNSDEASASDGYRGYGYYRYGRYTSRYQRNSGSRSNGTEQSPVLVSSRGILHKDADIITSTNAAAVTSAKSRAAISAGDVEKSAADSFDISRDS